MCVCVCVCACACRQPQHPGQRRTLVNFKWPKWWLQSFIAGVETIVMGTRDEAGNVIQVNETHMCNTHTKREREREMHADRGMHTGTRAAPSCKLNLGRRACICAAYRLHANWT